MTTNKVIKSIDSRMGRRGKRQTFSFSGVEAQEHIDEYMEEVRMTKADLESYKTAASTAAEAAAKAADDAVDAASKITDGVVEACNEAAEKATTAATTATESATSAEKSAAEAKKAAEQAGASISGVSSWNGRSGNVMPQSGDYTADMVDAVGTEAFNTALEQTTQNVTNTFAKFVHYVTLDGKNIKVTYGDDSSDTYTTQDTTYSNATTSTAGLMSASDKAKLNGIATGATKVTVDSALSSTSTNPVQNKAVYTALSNKADTASTVKSLSISGTTITATFGDGSTSTLTTQDTNTTYSAATTSAAGLMSASDKTKLNGIATGATKVTVDSSLSATSTNPVQNKVINTALSAKADASAVTALNTTVTTIQTEVNARPSTRRLATQTLTASGGTLTWTDDAIGDDALIDVYASIPNIAPSAITQSGTTCTVTFDAQDSAFDVAIVVM